MLMANMMMVMVVMMMMVMMMMMMMMMMKTNLGKKVPHDLVLVAAFLVCCSHVVWNVQDVPEQK